MAQHSDMHSTADETTEHDLADDSSVDENLSLAGRRIGFVGKLGGMNRKEVRDLTRQHGAVVLDRIDQTVNLVVVGEDQILDQAQLEDWMVDAAAEKRIEIINETQLWQRIGLVDSDASVCQLYTPAMLAKLLDVSIATIRRWHRRGLITPSRQVHRLPYFDFQEVATARRIARLIASGEAPSAIESKLSQLAELYPDISRPLSQLSVIVEGRHILLRQGEGLIEPGGQKRIDFDAIESDATQDVQESEVRDVISMDEPREFGSLDDLTTPEEFLELAIDFEDEYDTQSAIEVYRAMSLAFGPIADVCFRMAELLYQQDDLSGARERYLMAVELDETLVEARASLGCVLVESGQPQLALSAFHGALEHHPDYPDVHFHLGRLYDERDEAEKAEFHWQRFLDLAPHSPWAEEARDRLSIGSE